ncbi:MAG TPA: cation:proton antiporter [archaeon]|nr:cation:proton antiporter [archaeon]
MSRIFGLVVLVLLMALLVYLPAEARTQAPLSMLLGFLLLTGFVFGKIGNYIGLPGITGYLLAGVTLGPSCFGILDKASVNDLSLINSFALTLIALTAGGEVSLKRVRDRLSSFILITTSQVLLTFLGVTIIMAFLLGFFPERFALGLSNRFTVAIFLGIIALANSPSSTVAVIVETGARGRLSELALEITVIKDLVVILAFAFAMAVGSGVLNTSAGADSSNLIHDLAWEIGGSIVLYQFAFKMSFNYI